MNCAHGCVPTPRLAPARKSWPGDAWEELGGSKVSGEGGPRSRRTLLQAAPETGGGPSSVQQGNLSDQPRSRSHAGFGGEDAENRGMK